MAKKTLTQSLEQRQQLKLSPMQIRLVRMLEMTEPEIEEEVRREVDENPALEVVDSPTADENVNDTYNETSEELQLADYRDEDDIPPYRLEVNNRSANDTRYEPVMTASGDSLIESVMAQLSETDLTEHQLLIARYIAGNLDDNGYMTRTLPQIEDDLIIDSGIDVEMSEIKEVFDRIRQLDPAGIGAFDLRDCLLLQLKRLPESKAVSTAKEIVGHYFDLFSLRHFDRLSSLLGIDRQELKEADEVIRSLDPKPASHFGDNEAENNKRYIIPDFNIEVDRDERITVTMPGNIPELSIERSFSLKDEEDAVNNAKRDGNERKLEALSFITNKRREASDFIELLKMRHNTLMRVMEAIARWQKNFFVSEDESQLKPMVLKDISKATGLDISVISRATAGKYVATQGGIYPLKYFFNERVSEDEDASSHEILSAIKALIDEEDSSSPLSDDALTSRLNSMGYNIARRTVAKYRERLAIPVARLRKKI